MNMKLEVEVLLCWNVLLLINMNLEVEVLLCWNLHYFYCLVGLTI